MIISSREISKLPKLTGYWNFYVIDNEDELTIWCREHLLNPTKMNLIGPAKMNMINGKFVEAITYSLWIEGGPLELVKFILRWHPYMDWVDPAYWKVFLKWLPKL